MRREPSILARAVELAETARPFVKAARAASALCWTTTPVKFFAADGKIAAGFGSEDPDELTVASAAAVFAKLGAPVSVIDADDYATGRWVKVAESRLVSSIGEAMQLLPTREPKWWNHASPAAATIAGSLLGGGLGYLGGSVVDSAFGRRLPIKFRKLLGYAGMGLGATPGMLAYWANREAEVPRPWFDSSLRTRPKLACLDRETYRKIAFDSFAEPEAARPPSPYDVKIDALGRTLWYDGTAAAQTAAAASQVARRMPGGIGDEWITPTQFAQFAAAAGGNAIVGGLAGAALGKLTGSSGEALQRWRDAGTLAGVVRTIVPRLFGYSG